MGYGDELMGSGIARGAAARGKRIAFGDTHRIYWRHPHAHEIFQGNPNVAPPGSERTSDIEWVRHYSGHRLYARPGGGRWIWDYNFRAIPGEVFLTPEERAFAARLPAGLVLIEPKVKPSAPNKQWPHQRYAQLAFELVKRGYRVAQPFSASVRPLSKGVLVLPPTTFRQALAILERCILYVGPEGGLHHGAAAVGLPAVVIFGGFISPKLTGYSSHVNLAEGEACGTYGRICPHCAAAMNRISLDRVLVGVATALGGRSRHGQSTAASVVDSV